MKDRAPLEADPWLGVLRQTCRPRRRSGPASRSVGTLKSPGRSSIAATQIAMDKRPATPCLSLRLVVWNAPLISYNLVAARNRSLNAACALACPALPHGFAERVEIRSRHSTISQLRSRCCNGGNGANGRLGYSLLFRTRARPWCLACGGPQPFARKPFGFTADRVHQHVVDANSYAASAKSLGASSGRLCPAPSITRCQRGPLNFEADHRRPDRMAPT